MKISTSYFESIYTSSNPSNINEVTVAIPTRVTEEMNAELVKNFRKEEIVFALKQTHPTKALRPDGMSTVLYQKYWGIVGDNVVNMVLNVLNHNLPIGDLNKTNIALVLKTKSPKHMTEFKPISLCNVIYKLILKTLANRLKALLPLLISENQSAFTSDRLITENVLVAFELTHYLNHKTSGKDSFMTIKLDMSKAFDRVEWNFIKRVMERLGFNLRWISLIMQCITSVSYSVIINGATYGNIIPTMGLSQGDPLSPSLFLLCAEGLSSLIQEAAINQLINELLVCKGYPKITHLFFIDDSILFYKAASSECRDLKNILQIYEEASRQKINTDKSAIFFSPNTPQGTKDDTLAILGPMQDSRNSKYLGLPSIIGRSKSLVFTNIKQRVEQKLASWKGKLLSIGGREMLIKAVAQAVPTYAMSCFLLPKGLCEDLESIMRNFWWGQKEQETKVAWVSWRRMCKSKNSGGMGFRKLQASNLAMLAKQAWRILTNLNSLVARVLKAKYFPIGDVLNAKLGASPSYSWRSIHSSLRVIKEGTRWRVRNGKLIHIWDDKWLPTPSTYKVIPPPPQKKETQSNTPWFLPSLTKTQDGGRWILLELLSSLLRLRQSSKSPSTITCLTIASSGWATRKVNLM